MKDNITIDRAESSDYMEVATIYNEYIKDRGVTMDEQLKTESDIAKWVENFNDRERLFILKKGIRVIGWSMIKRYSEKSGYRTTCHTSTYLFPQERGKGYGTMLKKHTIQTCKELGYHHLVARIFGGNEVSIAYNKKLGYSLVGTQKEVGLQNGKWYDVVIMQYLIK